MVSLLPIWLCSNHFKYKEWTPYFDTKTLNDLTPTYLSKVLPYIILPHPPIFTCTSLKMLLCLFISIDFYISYSSYLECVFLLLCLAQSYSLLKTYFKIQELFPDSLILFPIPHCRKHLGNWRLIAAPKITTLVKTVFLKSDGYTFPLPHWHSSRNETKDW